MVIPRLGWWWVATPVLALGVVAFAAGHVRLAGFVLAGGLLMAALIRAVLPTALSGGLVVRSRVVDVATMALLGVTLAVITASLDLRPRG
ncbi:MULTISPECIES: DUF3017 domain-containing protein [unclassified Phycicoccus]|uniref:DUF3017 domain-containing protein n=1 Tax=unclassified Phycicoccus TaxID=2637926 RepID=UPI000AB1F7FE|nr:MULTISPECIES: DUF3017 domain-containing protein [unclassified Phycicoccus]